MRPALTVNVDDRPGKIVVAQLEKRSAAFGLKKKLNSRLPGHQIFDAAPREDHLFAWNDLEVGAFDHPDWPRRMEVSTWSALGNNQIGEPSRQFLRLSEESKNRLR